MVNNTVAKFSIEYYQYLNAQGELINPTEKLPAWAQDFATLQEAYRMMVLTRAFDNKAIALQRTGKLGTYPSSLGQEAVYIGIGNALEKQDVFCPSYRDWGTQLIRGVTMGEILTYWGGSERGSDFQASTAKEDLPNCIPIGSQCLHAAGIATAIKLRQQSRAALVTCGDGGTSQGDFYETINISGVWQLHLVIMIVNNQWAISVPRKSQTAAETLAQKAIAGGIPGEQVDGNDLIAVQDRVSRALKKAHEGGGPTVIEAITYRLSDHTTADDASRYRKKDELAEAWQNDPITRLRQYLFLHQAWSENEEKQLQQICSEQVAKAVDAYQQQPLESPENIFLHQYATMPTSLATQRDEFLAKQQQQG